MWKVEAESCQYSDCQIVSDNQYSGRKALQMTDEKARAEFVFDVAERGKYAVCVAGMGLGGEKTVNCVVNGSSNTLKLNAYGETEVGVFSLKEGLNSVVITPNWTWFTVDYVCVRRVGERLAFDISANLVDALATPQACNMYAFLLSNFGKKTISGMMTGDMGAANGNILQQADVQAVYKVSGKYPALIGFDLMNATGLKEKDAWYQEYTRACIDLAKDTYQRGGIPAFTWHWRDPSRVTDAFYTSELKMKISDAMDANGDWDKSSVLYRYFVRDIDTVADLFLELQEAGVACVFRPLHEASGGWFWWGRESAKEFCMLYRLVYDEMVRVKGVHNVIWVWNADPGDVEWNPGEEYFDIASTDIYNPDFDYSSNSAAFEKLKATTGGRKIIALAENGPIPDMQQEVDDEAVWSWWMPWYQTWGGNFVDKTSAEQWRKCMNDSRVITLDKLSSGWDTETAVMPVFSETPFAAQCYDLDGRALPNAGNGIYIKGGKKFISKK